MFIHKLSLTRTIAAAGLLIATTGGALPQPSRRVRKLAARRLSSEKMGFSGF
jgi:hypothetical protein